MFIFQLKRAIQSIISTPTVSIISIVAVTLGVGILSATSHTYMFFAQNPIPEKDKVLFNVRLDNWTTDEMPFAVAPGEPPKHSTYRDTKELMKSTIPLHQAQVGSANSYVFPKDRNAKPYGTRVRLTNSDFFPMFNIPFKYGHGWTHEQDEARELIVVLSHESNLRLFDGENSVGKSVHLGNRFYTVIGVLAPYQPMPIYYDIINSGNGKIADFFVPLDHIRESGNGLNRSGDGNAWGPRETMTGDSLYTVAEFNWIEFWVELSPDRLEDYKSYLSSYVMEQKALGRFPRKLNNRVTPVMEWIRERSNETTMLAVMVGISTLFLIACCVNITGLLLSKFLSTSNQTGIIRALGAKKSFVFIQYILECSLLALAGGILGIGVAHLQMNFINSLVPGEPLFFLNTTTILLAIAIALTTGILTGIYPAWRACRINPAIQIKIQ